MKAIAVLMLAWMQIACSPRLYRACFVGSYTGDTICGSPLKQAEAQRQVLKGFPGEKRFIKRVRKGEAGPTFKMNPDFPPTRKPRQKPISDNLTATIQYQKD